MLTPMLTTAMLCQHYQPTSSLSISETDITSNNDSSTDSYLQIQLLSSNATLPCQATPMAAGYDLCSAITCQLPPNQITKIPIDIAIQPPKVTYAQIASCSSLFTDHDIVCQACVIDADSHGNVQILLHNSTSSSFVINKGDCIAQMLLIRIALSTVLPSTELSATSRDTKGFGSMGVHSILPSNNSHVAPIHLSISVITSPMDSELSPMDSELLPQLNDLPDLPYHIYLSMDFFDNILEHSIATYRNRTRSLFDSVQHS